VLNDDNNDNDIDFDKVDSQIWIQEVQCINETQGGYQMQCRGRGKNVFIIK